MTKIDCISGGYCPLIEKVSFKGKEYEAVTYCKILDFDAKNIESIDWVEVEQVVDIRGFIEGKNKNSFTRRIKPPFDHFANLKEILICYDPNLELPY